MTISEMTQKIEELETTIIQIKYQLTKIEDPNSLIRKEVNRIIAAVEFQYNLPEGTLYIDIQKRSIVEPRQMAMVILYHVTNLNLNSIGLIFHRNHATVTYARKTMTALLETNDDIRNKFIKVCHQLEIDKELVNKIITNAVYNDNRGKNSAK